MSPVICSSVSSFLIRPELHQRSLVPAIANGGAPGCAYDLVVPAHRMATAAVTAFRQWIEREASEPAR
jgi:hypothetical protein